MKKLYLFESTPKSIFQKISFYPDPKGRLIFSDFPLGDYLPAGRQEGKKSLKTNFGFFRRILLFLFFLVPYLSYSQVWKSFGADSLYIANNNPNSFVSEFKIINGKLFVGGVFTKSGIINSSGIAVWDSLSWDSLQSGVFGGGNVMSICSFQNKIYIGGNFWYVPDSSGIEIPNTSRFACWNGTSWQAVGNIGVPNGTVEAISFKDKLFISGGFAYIGSIYFRSMAAWDGSQWYHVSNFDNGASDFAVYNNELYAGGNFTTISGTPNYCVGIARYDGTLWHDVGGGLDGYVKAMVTDTINNVLYVAGYFLRAGFLIGGDTINPSPVYVRGIAKWNGSQWSDVGGGFSPDVRTLCMYRGELYAGGWFDTAGTQAIRYIARYDGTEWKPVGTGVDGFVSALAVYKDELYVGGIFKHAGGLASSSIAKWYIHPDSVTINTELLAETNEHLVIYPNPNNGSFTAEINLQTKEKTVLKVYNAKGQLFRRFVFETGQTKKDIDTSKWAKGMYYCVLEEKGMKKDVKKIIIE